MIDLNELSYREALNNFCTHFCLNDPMKMAVAESAFYACHKSIMSQLAAPAAPVPTDEWGMHTCPRCQRKWKEMAESAPLVQAHRALQPAQGERRPYPANQSDYVLVPRMLLEWAQQNIDCVEDEDERERVSAALDAAMK